MYQNSIKVKEKMEKTGQATFLTIFHQLVIDIIIDKMLKYNKYFI